MRFLHISTSGLGVVARRASFTAVLGRPLQVTVYRMLRDHSSVCPVCNVDVLWPNGWMDQDSTWYGDRPPPRRHCVRCLTEGTQQLSRLFGPCLLWTNGRPSQQLLSSCSNGRPKSTNIAGPNTCLLYTSPSPRD